MARSGGWRSRAPCAPGPELLCLDEPAAGLNPRGIAGAQRAAQRHQGQHRHLDPADRARHVGGHADFRPRRGARIRPQDFRRRPDVGENRPEVIAAYLGVDDEEVERVLVEVGDDRHRGTRGDPAPTVQRSRDGARRRTTHIRPNRACKPLQGARSEDPDKPAKGESRDDLLDIRASRPTTATSGAERRRRPSTGRDRQR